jgi:hypothetical protein
MQIEIERDTVADSTAAIINQQINDEVCGCPKCEAYRNNRTNKLSNAMPQGFDKW